MSNDSACTLGRPTTWLNSNDLLQPPARQRQTGSAGHALRVGDGARVVQEPRSSSIAKNGIDASARARRVYRMCLSRLGNSGVPLARVMKVDQLDDVD